MFCNNQIFLRSPVLLKENGIAAVSIIMYLQFIFIGIYFGYSMGISPLLSYAYGRGHLSGIITFFRSFGLLLSFLILLPKIWGITGIWLAVPAAEMLTLLKLRISKRIRGQAA